MYAGPVSSPTKHVHQSLPREKEQERRPGRALGALSCRVQVSSFSPKELEGSVSFFPFSFSPQGSKPEQTWKEMQETPWPADYKPIHPEIFSFDENFLDNDLRETLRNLSKDKLKKLLEANIIGVFSLRCFTREFCQKFCQELDNLEKCQPKKMKSMNNMSKYGAQLNRLGFKVFLDNLLAKVINPLVSARTLNQKFFSFLMHFCVLIFFVNLSLRSVSLFQASIIYENEGGKDLKYQHSFTVNYSAGTDRKLISHVDDATVTFNVCLGKEFEGSSVYFVVRCTFFSSGLKWRLIVLGPTGNERQLVDENSKEHAWLCKCGRA
jgi:hypothetical protein